MGVQPHLAHKRLNLSGIFDPGHGFHSTGYVQSIGLNRLDRSPDIFRIQSPG